jgi:S1-C subfamily serine protease
MNGLNASEEPVMRRRLLVVLVLFGASAVFGQDAASKRAALRTPVVDALERAAPAVVNISTEKIITLQTSDPLRSLLDDNLYDQFFDRYPRRNVLMRSLGSGVIFDKRGYIVTNEHVVRRASRITVTLQDGSSCVGKLISADPSRDLAVIRIVRNLPFPTVNIYRAVPPMTGETAIAVGNPFGFEHTVTVGVVSATGRNVAVKGQVVMQNLIQTDASINPGNSGGALLDANGDLIGINTAIRSGAEGIGFAVPVDELRKALVDLVDFRRLTRLHVGMRLAGLMSTRTGELIGMRVIELQPGAPAEKAGLKPGDIITTLNGQRCVDVLAFEIDVLERLPGDKLVLGGRRDDKPFEAALILEQTPLPDPNAVISRRLGISVAKLTQADAARAGTDPGVGIIISAVVPGGPAAAVGIRKDDVILLFANFRVGEPEELASGLERVRAGERTVMVFSRKGFKYYAWVVPQ